MQELLTFPTDELKHQKETTATLTIDVQVSPFNAEKDMIQFGHLLKEAKERVLEDAGEEVWAKMSKQIDHLEKKSDFWRNHSGGMIFYLTADECYYYQLSSEVGHSCFVSDQPNVLPLLREFQFVNHFQLLCLNNDGFQLFNGRGAKIEKIELEEDTPDTLTKALGTELTGGELNVGSYGGAQTAGGVGMFHGHNEKSREVEIDQENYFRIVDEYIYEHFSKVTTLPLVLFALPENETVFRKLSINQFLSEESIKKSPVSLTDQEIESETDALTKQVTEKRLRKLLETFEETIPSLRLEAQHQDLAMASVEGRIDYVMIEQNTVVKGMIDENGQFESGPRNDFLNQLAWNVLNANGRVYVLDRMEMPSSETILAGLRY